MMSACNALDPGGPAMRIPGPLVALSVLLLVAACGGGDGGEPPAAPPKTVLVTGATGTQGGAVARELLRRGYTVRALTRSPDKPAALELASQGAEIYQGNFDDEASLDAAMAGVDGVFAVTDFWEHGYDREVAHGLGLIAAAERAAVGHFVFTSVAGADADTGLAHFDSKREIEEDLMDSDLAYTILRPVEFMDNWRFSREQLLAGQYVNPRDAGEHHQWIAAADIGFFAAEAFDNPAEWVGRTQGIAGDQMTLGKLVAVMSEAFGRPVEYVQVSWEDFEQAVGPELAEMYRWFQSDGYSIDITALRKDYPELVTVEEYLGSLAAAD